MTVKVCPPTVIVPDRRVPVFAATVKFIVPFPLLLLELVIHPTFGVAFHAQPEGAVIPNELFPPAAGICWLDGFRL